MPSAEETHAKALLESAHAYAKRAGEVLFSDARLKGKVPPPFHSSIMIEIGRFHLFLIFSSLRDKEHRDNAFFERVSNILREQFLKLEARRLIQLCEEFSGMPEGQRLWRELEPEKDPLEPYYGSFDGGCKTLEDSPFGVVARRISSRFFPEELAATAYDAVLSITLDTADRVTKEIDEIRNAA